MGEEKLRIYSKDTDNKGQPLGPTEIHFRIQCYLKDITPKVAFDCMADSVQRNSWDTRMSDIKKVKEEGNEEILHYFVYSTMPFISHRDVVARKQ